MLFCLCKFAESQQGAHEKRLLNNLLATYNTLERPVANESDPLVVKFGLTLQQIIDVVSVLCSLIPHSLLYQTINAVHAYKMHLYEIQFRGRAVKDEEVF